MKGFIDDVNQKSGDYGSLPFWSWNDRLDEEELRRQMRVMKDIGMNGFFMHARGGLETEYLSDEWYSCINACIDEAKKLGMEAWSYDENGWPSGFAGGILLEDPANHAVAIRHEFVKDFLIVSHRPTTLSRFVPTYWFLLTAFIVKEYITRATKSQEFLQDFLQIFFMFLHLYLFFPNKYSYINNHTTSSVIFP